MRAVRAQLVGSAGGEDDIDVTVAACTHGARLTGGGRHPSNFPDGGVTGDSSEQGGDMASGRCWRDLPSGPDAQVEGSCGELAWLLRLYAICFNTPPPLLPRPLRAPAFIGVPTPPRRPTSRDAEGDASFVRLLSAMTMRLRCGPLEALGPSTPSPDRERNTTTVEKDTTRQSV